MAQSGTLHQERERKTELVESLGEDRILTLTGARQGSLYLTECGFMRHNMCSMVWVSHNGAPISP